MLTKHMFDAFVSKAESLAVEATTECKATRSTFMVLKKDGNGDFYLPSSAEEFDSIMNNVKEFLNDQLDIVVIVSGGYTIHSTAAEKSMTQKEIDKHLDSHGSMATLPGAIEVLNIIVHSVLGQKVIQYKIGKGYTLTKITDTEIGPGGDEFTRVRDSR